MAREERGKSPPPACLAQPQVSLLGEVGATMVEKFLDQLADASKGDQDIAVEISTSGGDAEFGRRLVLEVDLARKRLKQRLVFLGKTHVYSAGVTLMSAFPREDRYLTGDCMLLIHCRHLEKTVEVSGPLRSSLPMLEALCEQMKIGIALEEEGFRRLIEGSDVTLDEIAEEALHNWYLPAETALERRLVADIV